MGEENISKMTNTKASGPVPTALTIAGSDPSGGAGLQADLKTFSSFGVYGMTVVTGLTAGNTRGVKDITFIDPGFILKQLQCVLEDIQPAAVKTGMLNNEETIRLCAEELAGLSSPLVVDPVMVTKRGDVLLSEKEIKFYRSHLLPLADMVTPNIPEAELLADQKIDSIEEMERAAQTILALGCRSVVVKGGHNDEWEHSNDLFFDGEEMVWLRSERIPTVHTHGAGDAFSAAITALLAKGGQLADAAAQAKEFITEAISTAPGLGKGEGPVNLFIPNSK